MKNLITHFLKEVSGIEYSLVPVLISIVIIDATGHVGKKLDRFNNIRRALAALPR